MSRETIVDLTDARALIRMVQTDSAKIMSRLCAIDLRDRSFQMKAHFAPRWPGWWLK